MIGKRLEFLFESFKALGVALFCFVVVVVVVAVVFFASMRCCDLF
jgi:hypothetical protein